MILSLLRNMEMIEMVKNNYFERLNNHVIARDYNKLNLLKQYYSRGHFDHSGSYFLFVPSIINMYIGLILKFHIYIYRENKIVQNSQYIHSE